MKRRSPDAEDSIINIELDASAFDAKNPAHRDRLYQEIRKLIGFLNAMESVAGVPQSFAAAVTPAPAPSPTVLRVKQGKGKAYPNEPSVDPITFHKGSWNDTVFQILTEANAPVDYDYVRSKLLETSFGNRIKQGDRTYYAVIQKLKQLGLCKVYNGMMATPVTLKRFLDEVAAGRAQDVRVLRFRNKYAMTITGFLEVNPDGASFNDITVHCAETLNKERTRTFETQVSNELRKLLNERIITRLSKGFYQLTHENEAPEKLRASEAAASEARH
jgi:hypothetical protein